MSYISAVLTMTSFACIRALSQGLLGPGGELRPGPLLRLLQLRGLGLPRRRSRPSELQPFGLACDITRLVGMKYRD